MATLADELQADFLDLESDEENEDQEQDNDEDNLNGKDSGDTAMDEDDAEDEEGGDQQDKVNRALDEAEDQDEAKSRIDKINLKGVSDFKSVATLWKSLSPVLEQIDEYQSLPPEEQAKKNLGKSDSPAYKLMNEANSLSTHIDSEIIVLHKWLRDHYSAFFPGLERLVETPTTYARAVAIIGNGPMDVKAVGTSSENPVGQSLDKVLDKALLMSVRMEAATTKTTPLPDAEIKMIMRACEMVLALDKAKEKIRDFVTGCMNSFAPNLSVLVGAETAALLVQAAGGTHALAIKPANTLANIGWKPSRVSGGATNAFGGGAKQKGHIFNSPIIRAVPIDHRTQAIRIVAAKIALAARVDDTQRVPDNSVGRQLAEEVARRLDVLTENAPNRGPRALPAPDEKPSRKRGGKRARAAKARDQQSEMAKMANRLAMGGTETEMGYGAGDSTVGLGMIGQETGKIRQAVADKRTIAKLSKRNQAILGSSSGSGLASSLRGFGPGGGTVTGLRTSGVGTSLGGNAGTASVIAFTEKSFGLELADPRNRDEADRKRKAEEDKYFKTGTFTNVGGGTSSMLPSKSRVDSGGFKVPALPALKRVKRQT